MHRARSIFTLPGSFHSGTNGKPYITTTDKLRVISVYHIYAKHLYPMDVIPLWCYLTDQFETQSPITRSRLGVRWCAINRSRKLKRCTRSIGTEPYISWKLLIIPFASVRSGRSCPVHVRRFFPLDAEARKRYPRLCLTQCFLEELIYRSIYKLILANELFLSISSLA